MPSITRGRSAVQWYETRESRKGPPKKEAALTRIISTAARVCRAWEPSEDAVIFALYRSKGSRFVAERLPGRDFRSVQSRARVLGVAERRP